MTVSITYAEQSNGAPFQHLVNARDLMAKEFPEPRWAIPGLIPEGLTVLAGQPKVGKSWFAIDVGVSIATGAPALGSINVVAGPVLYLALEDPERRLKARLTKRCGAEEPDLGNLDFVTKSAPLPTVADSIRSWLDARPAARLVIVDVLRMIRPRTYASSKEYEQDYETLRPLKELADDYAVAVLVVTHTRKQRDEEDRFREVSGSTGLTGAADATIVLEKGRGAEAATFHLTGRDVEERSMALRWQSLDARWIIDDLPAELARLGPAAQAVWQHVNTHPGTTPNEIALAIDMNHENVRSHCSRLATRGVLVSDHGRYYTKDAHGQ